MPPVCRWVPAVLLLASSTVSARSLDAAGAVALALDHSHALAAAEAGVDKARAEATGATLQLFPQLSVAGGYTRLDQAPYVEFDTSAFTGGSSDACADISEDDLPSGWTLEMAQGLCEMITSWMMPDTGAGPTVIQMGLQDNYFVKASVEQVLYAGGALRRARRAALASLDASEEQVRQARLEVAFAAEQAFWGLALARRAAAVAAEAQATVDAYVRDLENLAQVGMANRADLLAAQARQSKARLDAMRAAHGASLAETAFKVTLGLPPDEPLELELGAVPSVLGLPADRQALVRMAVDHRPDLGMLDASLEAIGHAAGAAWASWLPAVLVQGNLNWKNPNYSLEPEWYRSADLTVAASWALWDRGQALQRHRATMAQWEQLHRQRAQLAEMLEVELVGALSTWDEAGAELEVARVGLAQAEEALRLEEERFRQGVANNTELLGAQAQVAGARLAELQAETTLHMAHAALRKAVGMDPEDRR